MVIVFAEVVLQMKRNDAFPELADYRSHIMGDIAIDMSRVNIGSEERIVDRVNQADDIIDVVFFTGFNRQPDSARAENSQNVPDDPQVPFKVVCPVLDIRKMTNRDVDAESFADFRAMPFDIVIFLSPGKSR